VAQPAGSDMGVTGLLGASLSSAAKVFGRHA